MIAWFRSLLFLSFSFVAAGTAAFLLILLAWMPAAWLRWK